MRRIFRSNKLAVFLLSVFLVSCNSAANKDHVPWPVEVIGKSQQCGTRGSSPVLTVIRDTQMLQQYYRAINRTKIIERKLIPVVDFSRFNVVLVEMGKKPTAGYSLTLNASMMKIQGESAVISVNWNEPAPGRILAQVITSPCVMFQIPSKGYSRVKILDQDGVVRLRK